MSQKTRSKNRTIIILVLIVILIILFCLFLFYRINRPLEGTISSIAYNINDKNYRVYIKENDKYVPYLALDNNYNYTHQTILLREHALGGQNSIKGYNGTIDENQIIYDDEKMMGFFLPYEETEVDNFLLNIFPDYFDDDFIKIVNDTEIDVELEAQYTIKRKFFLLSFQEVSGEYYPYGKNARQIAYFTNNDLTIENDYGHEVTWWVRTYGWEDYMFAGYSNLWGTHSGTDTRRSVRPAFTLSGNTKIKEGYLDDRKNPVYFIDY